MLGLLVTHYVDVWVDGIGEPFRLRFNRREGADRVYAAIGTATTNRELSEEHESGFDDDYGQRVGFKLSRVIGMRISCSAI